jgi:hypothetical protein
LEGGYDLEALATSAVAHCAVLSAGYSALLETDLEPSTAAVEQSNEEQSYGGDECAALEAYIKSLKIWCVDRQTFFSDPFNPAINALQLYVEIQQKADGQREQGFQTMFV